jgi:hypothetical protein
MADLATSGRVAAREDGEIAMRDVSVYMSASLDGFVGSDREFAQPMNDIPMVPELRHSEHGGTRPFPGGIVVLVDQPQRA